MTIKWPPTIINRNIELVQLNEQHLPFIEEWHNDPDTFQYTRTESKRNLPELRAWYIADYSRWAREQIYIVYKEVPIGYVTATPESVDVVEVGIVIGKQHRKTQIGYNALCILCQTVFSLGVRKIRGRILTVNKPALSLVAKMGFKHEGTQRKEIFHLGEYHNLETFSLFKDELTYETLASTEL